MTDQRAKAEYAERARSQNSRWSVGAVQDLEAQRDRLEQHLNLALGQIDRLEDALRAIRGPEDQGYWIEVYREHGGGYEGLQAIADAALNGPAENTHSDTEEGT